MKITIVQVLPEEEAEENLIDAIEWLLFRGEFNDSNNLRQSKHRRPSKTRVQSAGSDRDVPAESERTRG